MIQRLSYTEGEVEALTGIKRKTLERWRLDGSGPPWVRAGKRLIRYPAISLHEWMASRPGGGERIAAEVR
jgi:predicted DNA-binding transcriptional regulator AlpA